MPASALAKAARQPAAANKNVTGRPALRIIQDEGHAIAAPGTRELQHQPETEISGAQVAQAEQQDGRGVEGIFASSHAYACFLAGPSVK